jgi:apolipoprotein N-acyltransferase
MCGLRKTNERKTMGIGVSLVLSAVGAILIWAVNTSSSGFNVHVAGVILLVIGIIGFLISLMFWSSWGGFGAFTANRAPREGNTTTVVR